MHECCITVPIKAKQDQIFKLCQGAQEKWNRLNRFTKLPHVIRSVNFIDGITEDEIKTLDQTVAG